jgi:hypothetical protein
MLGTLGGVILPGLYGPASGDHQSSR